MSAHDHPAATGRPCSALPPMSPRQIPRPARVLACGFIALLLGLGACGKKAGEESTENASGKSASPAGFPDDYVPPPPEGQFMEIEEVEDGEKTLLRYKVEITNSSSYPKKWFEGAPELPSIGKLSTASRCVIEVRGPDDKVLHQFAEAERDLRMPVWFAAPPGASVPESVRIVIHDRKTKQRYQSEPIALPQPDPTEEELAGISREE